MAFKSTNFYLENLEDKSFIGSDSNSTSNTISQASYSEPLTFEDINIDWPIAVDYTSVVIGHTNNVKAYIMSDLNFLSRGVTIPIVANSLSIDYDFIFAGNSTSNVVYQYDKKAVLHNTIISLNANSTSSFGQKIRAKDGILLVAAPNNYSNVGSVHMFDYRGVELAVLRPNNSNQYSGFGTSIDLEDNLIAVGAPFDIEGKVYLYDYSGDLKKVLAGPNVNSRFGYSVAVGFSSILIGAPNVTSTGGAYIYGADGNEIKYINTGISTCHMGDYTAIESGKAILFAPGSSSLNHKIFSHDLQSNSYSQNGFGYSVDIGTENRIGIATSNGNVFLSAGQNYFSGQKNIYTFSIQRRTHILEELSY